MFPNCAQFLTYCCGSLDPQLTFKGQKVDTMERLNDRLMVTISPFADEKHTADNTEGETDE